VEDLIKTLAEAWGPPGFEHHVRDLIRAEVEPLADEVRVDALGNLICRIGDGDLRVMTAAHMDEIGLIVGHVDRQGFARFTSIGTLYPATLLGARVRFENGMIGTIGVENQHSDRYKLPNLSGFYIDCSASVDENGSASVKVGDPAAFVGEVVVRGDRIVGKSLDNRLGCAIQIEAMRRVKAEGTPHTVYFVFTVQEEVGSRGARPAAHALAPHVGLAIDTTPAGDVPKGRSESIALGAGTAIKTRDTGLIVPAAVRDLLVARAEAADIPYQIEVLVGGSTDGRMIQLAQAGVPTGGIVTPVRYVHTQSETADRRDVQASIDLLAAVLTQPIDL
jgi:endoglucanase